MKTYLFLSLFFTVFLSYGQWTYSNLSEPKVVLGATSLGSKAYFAGGSNANGSIHFKKVEIYDVKTKTWSFNDLSTARAFIAGVSCGSKVFFAAGIINNKSIDVVDIYDTITQQWTVEHLSVAKNLVAAVAKGNKVLFAGGFNSGDVPSNVVDIYDIQTGQWSKDTLSMARASMGVAVVGDLALFAGGFDMKKYTDRVDIYNFTTGKWTTDTLSMARGLTGAASVGNKVLIAGGMTDPKSSTSSTDLVEIYDAETGKWSTAKLSFPRCFTERTAITVGEKAYFIGGGNFSGTALNYNSTSNIIDIYDNRTGTWSVDALTHDVINHGVTAVDNTLLVAGGWSSKEDGVVSTVEIFTANTSSSPELMDDPAFKVYPNPGKDILNIASPNGVTVDIAVIYNQSGQKVQQLQPMNNRISISKLKKGMYFLVLIYGQKEVRKKFIVE